MLWHFTEKNQIRFLKTSSGKIFLDFAPNLNKSFNRGFTDYFLKQRERCYNFYTPKSIGEELGQVKKWVKIILFWMLK